MKSIKRDDIAEESRFIADCPYCGSFTEIDDYNDYTDEAHCEHCNEEFKIEDE